MPRICELKFHEKSNLNCSHNISGLHWSFFISLDSGHVLPDLGITYFSHSPPKITYKTHIGRLNRHMTNEKWRGSPNANIQKQIRENCIAMHVNPEQPQ